MIHLVIIDYKNVWDIIKREVTKPQATKWITVTILEKLLNCCNYSSRI